MFRDVPKHTDDISSHFSVLLSHQAVDAMLVCVLPAVFVLWLLGGGVSFTWSANALGKIAAKLLLRYLWYNHMSNIGRV